MKFVLPLFFLTSGLFASEQKILDVLATQNDSSPLESAEAMGIDGFSVSVGSASLSLDDSQRDLVSNAYGLEKPASGRVYTPKLWLSKGLFYPLNVGAGIGRNQELGTTQLMGHLQWTLFEALALPAIALRGAHSRLEKKDALQINTTSLDLVASWGIRMVTIFGAFGKNFHKTKVNDGLNNVESVATSKNFQDSHMRLGVGFNVLPGLFKLTFEGMKKPDMLTSYQMKVGVYF